MRVTYLLIFAALPSLAAAQTLKTDAEILSSFSAIAAKCSAAFSRGPYIYEQAQHSRWGKQVFSNVEIKYDVQRTNSLVSPHTGQIIMRYIAAVVTAPTEVEVSALDVDVEGRALSQSGTINFALQDGRWKTVSMEQANSFRLHKGENFDTPMKITMNREKTLGLNGPARECVL